MGRAGTAMRCAVVIHVRGEMGLARAMPVHMRQAELLVGQAVRRALARSERNGGRRHDDAQRVQRGDKDRHAPPRRSGQPSKHPTTDATTPSR